MKINDLEKLLGVKRSSIFYYEREGLLEPAREDNNYREYSEADLRRLKLVVVLRKLGFTVAEIRDMLRGERALSDVLPENIARLQEQTDELGEAMALCREMERQGLTLDGLDPDEWFNTVERREREGRRFLDILGDAADGVTHTLAFMQESIGMVGPAYALYFFSEEGIRKRRLWKLYWILLAVGYLLLLAESYLLPGQYMRLVNPWAALVYTLIDGLIGSLVLWFCARFVIPGRKPRRALAITILLVAGVNMLLGVVGREATRMEVDEESFYAWTVSTREGRYTGDDPVSYVQEKYNERYYGGRAELDVWQTDDILFVFTSKGISFRFCKNDAGDWVEYDIAAPVDGLLYTADPYGPQKYPSRLMLTDGTVIEPVYEARFSTGYVPLYVFDVSEGQEYTGIEFGVDENGALRYELCRTEYAGASVWEDPIDDNEIKYMHTAAEVLSAPGGGEFLAAYRAWRDGIWASEPDAVLDTATLGAEWSFALYAEYVAPPCVSIRPDAVGAPDTWGLNEYTETLYLGAASNQMYYADRGMRLLWQMACDADVTPLLLADTVTPELLWRAALSVRYNEVAVAPGIGTGTFVYTRSEYSETRMWYVDVPEALCEMGGAVFQALNK